MTTTELNAFVIQRIEVAPGLVILRVVPDGWTLPDFMAGQFAVLGLPGTAPRIPGSGEDDAAPKPRKLIKRAFSIASSSVAKEYMEFYITLVTSGAFTPRLFVLKPADRIWLGPKVTGTFTLAEVPADRNIVMIATGTGLAPYMSMLRTHLVAGEERKYAVIHGARHSWDLGYRAELMTLQRICPNLTYLPFISRPAEEGVGWAGPVGHVQDIWAQRSLDATWGFHPGPDNTHIFLCGNPAMIEEMVKILEGEGFREHSRRQPGQIHLERYW